MEGLAVPFNAIAEGLEVVRSAIRSIGSDIVDSIVSNINNLKEKVLDVVQAVQNIPELFGTVVRNLFLPSEGYIEGKLTFIRNKFDSKLSLFNDIQNLIETVFDALANADENPPEFKISIPKWGFEGTIIDLSFYAQYRTWLHGIILVTCWALYLWKSYKRIPSLMLLPS